jgi:hypothetical protein
MFNGSRIWTLREAKSCSADARAAGPTLRSFWESPNRRHTSPPDRRKSASSRVHKGSLAFTDFYVPAFFFNARCVRPRTAVRLVGLQVDFLRYLN